MHFIILKLNVDEIKLNQDSIMANFNYKVQRYTVNARKCTAISTLRGDVGASLQATRDMKTKILFIKHILRDNNLLKEIFLQQYDNKKCTKWITQIKKFMEILQINIHMIETYSVMTIKKMIKNYDNKQWHEDLQNKSTLKLYRKFKFTIQDEQRLYDNTAASTTLFEARSGTLRLNDFLYKNNR